MSGAGHSEGDGPRDLRRDTGGCDCRGAVGSAAVVVRARGLRGVYARRVEVLGRRLSSEIPWNILLDLLVTEAEGRSVSVTALAHGAQAALTTTLRYVELLCEAGYVVRIVDGMDRRRSQARLTARGRRVLEELLAR